MKAKVCISIDNRVNDLVKEDMRKTGKNRSQVIEDILRNNYLAEVLLGEFQNED